jgi:hypothetical protein
LIVWVGHRHLNRLQAGQRPQWWENLHVRLMVYSPR